ncbi:hypothetical protein K402DRAFT_265504 [Aulographum hederae CBS 113979]|uniref:Uncharacterized protein n=1 Tax=Aulographum hederae CBS 113979 TaxID=1176131 RepID=A0A6G1GIP6_9PEZI|nr:hypothetical protein K402DRAFT_265504 [Aulographum hederae CBS 113979]
MISRFEGISKTSNRMKGERKVLAGTTRYRTNSNPANPKESKKTPSNQSTANLHQTVSSPSMPSLGHERPHQRDQRNNLTSLILRPRLITLRNRRQHRPTPLICNQHPRNRNIHPIPPALLLHLPCLFLPLCSHPSHFLSPLLPLVFLPPLLLPRTLIRSIHLLIQQIPRQLREVGSPAPVEEVGGECAEGDEEEGDEGVGEYEGDRGVLEGRCGRYGG